MELFEPADNEGEFRAHAFAFKLNDEQQQAVELIAAWVAMAPKRQPWISLTGPGGVGKTSVLRIVAPILQHPLYAATTGKAATRMREAAGLYANTLHKTLYGPPTVDEDTGEIRFTNLRAPEYGSTLVIDEASMITPQVAKDLRTWTNVHGVRILFVGDGFQLPPILSKDEVRAGVSEDYSIFGLTEGPALTQVMRNGDAILDAATMLRTKAKLPTDSRGGYRFRFVPDCIDQVVADYLEDPDDHGLVTWTNRTRMLANQIIRGRRGITGEVPQIGEPILIRKNTHVAMNGEVVTIARIEPGEAYGPVPTWNIETTCGRQLRVHGWHWTGEPPYIEDRDRWKEYRRAVEKAIRVWDWKDGAFDHESLNPEPIPVTYGYALTVHAAQGSQFRRVSVFMPSGDAASSHFKKPTLLPDGSKMPFGIRFYYTAVTRACEQLTVLVGK